ncbi:MAG TPA: DUF6455 family protein [Hyphomicrobiaceae bacterium]|nr:DUF6455 family protein [Hyphomicrobiaceae bacterium]
MSWPMYRRVERQAVRLHQMMERLGVNPGRMARLRNGDGYAEARSVCLYCGTSDRCLRWLDRQEPPDGQTTITAGKAGGPGNEPEFCPNLAAFNACRMGKATPGGNST